MEKRNEMSIMKNKNMKTDKQSRSVRRRISIRSSGNSNPIVRRIVNRIKSFKERKSINEIESLPTQRSKLSGFQNVIISIP